MTHTMLAGPITGATFWGYTHIEACDQCLAQWSDWSRVLVLTDEMYWLLRCWLKSSCSASWRWEETQPLSEPVDPERQREDEPELSVAETHKIRLSHTCDVIVMSSRSLHSRIKVRAVSHGPDEQTGHRKGVCWPTHWGLAAGLVFLLIFLDKGSDERGLSRSGGYHLAAGREGQETVIKRFAGLDQARVNGKRTCTGAGWVGRAG